EALLDRLDAVDDEQPAFDQRRERRYAFRVRNCTISVVQPGSMRPESFEVHLRNLSAGGISFLHGGFLHVGTEVNAKLVDGTGKWNEVVGKVANCDYIENGVHEVGVILKSPIVPSDFCAAANCIRILLIDDDVIASRLVIHMLKDFNAEVDFVESGKAAIQAIDKEQFDAIFCDIEMPEMNGIETVQSIRDAGFKAPIFGISASENEADHNAMINAGCNEFVTKPVTSQVLKQLLSDIVVEPLASALHAEPEMIEFLRSFGNQLEETIHTISSAMTTNDLTLLSKTVRQLKGNAGQYGYPMISDLARTVESELAGGTAITELGNQIDELRLLCRRAQVACQTD
ncbi:MAG: response regulator, partial [Planctomycetota bacterium]